jgi:hypothetical protein
VRKSFRPDKGDTVRHSCSDALFAGQNNKKRR